MAVSSVSSNTKVSAPPPAQQAEAKQTLQNPRERSIAPPPPAPPPLPTLNNLGQRLGTILNAAA
ncbi:MAG: hypothetical protein V4463_24480 [Pseudomonadota bacterium]